MTTLLLVALLSNAQLAFLSGAFLAGSMRRWNLIWAACMVGIGSVAGIFLLTLSVDRVSSVFDLYILRIAQEVIKNADYRSVIQGFLLGVVAPLVGFGVIAMVLRNRGRQLGPALTVFMALVALGLTLGLVITAQ